MATSGGTEEQQQFDLLGKTLKEGERLLAPTRRPDGTLRKPIRIRAGYVPQDEVAIYQSKGALLRKGLGAPEVPPGRDPVLDAKLKSKSARRNERKKEKKQQQAAIEKGKNLESKTTGEVPSAEDMGPRSKGVESVTDQMNMLDVSETPPVVAPSTDSTVCPSTLGPGPDLDKRIRALKKKCTPCYNGGHGQRMAADDLPRQQKTEQKDMKPGQLEKVAKLEGWCEELKLLEDEKAELAVS
ncbi:partner of Y14 and mago-like isoform X3 [Macadamia integrifolia]|uniref:partner of Y14 and mago-like isoform X3 n=1 Tax=Macadamia integrifolia TaxID=60698 RepID=UPI001C4F7B3C|nr:partner of Y14 and mago-like isoform X3 [Macadamia integrifolia]XP_042496662.1 partner of Y14 and mago-like isoform X3 [Macadamia integrifolia]